MSRCGIGFGGDDEEANVEAMMDDKAFCELEKGDDVAYGFGRIATWGFMDLIITIVS